MKIIIALSTLLMPVLASTSADLPINDRDLAFIDEAEAQSLRGNTRALTANGFACGNLIKNWSFEEGVHHSGAKQLHSIPHWHVPSRVEVWRSGTLGAPSKHGKYHLEMDVDADGVDGIAQDIYTKKNVPYYLRFYVRSRGNHPQSDSEGVVVQWDGIKLKRGTWNAKRVGEWTQYNVLVLGRGKHTRLTFRESFVKTSQDQKGGLLDAVQLYEIKKQPPCGYFACPAGTHVGEHVQCLNSLEGTFS